MDVVVAVVAEDRMIPGSTECYHNGSAGRFIFLCRNQDRSIFFLCLLRTQFTRCAYLQVPSLISAGVIHLLLIT